jgi:uncharacterized protein (TIGR02271 family)
MAQTEGRPIETLSEEQIPELRNVPVYANGDEIGHVGDIYYDEDAGTVQCVGVAGDGLGFKRQWIPARGAMLREDGLHVGYGRDQAESAPRWDDEQDLDESRFDEVQTHFTRHEEELSVGKEQTQAGSVKLRKWTETEGVAMDVDLRHETAQVVREEIDQPIGRDTDAFTDEEVEVPLSAERAVVSKQVVAKERVGVEKGVETHTETVQDEVRKERVRVDSDGEVEQR